MRPLTPSYFLLLLLQRLSLLVLPLLLGICLSSPWSPPFPLPALALISLSLSQVQHLLTLTLSPSLSGALEWRFCSFWKKAALVYLPTALSVVLRLLFLFHQAQYVQVFLLKPAPFCMLFAGLGSTNKSATSLFFCMLFAGLGSTNKSATSLFFFFYLTLALCSPPNPLLRFSFYHNLSGRSSRNCFLSPPVLSGYNGPPDTRFSRGTTWLMGWPDGERYLRPLQSLVVSYPLFSFVGLEAKCFIEILRHTGSLNFHQETCAPWSRSLCFLSSTLQRTQPSVKLLSLQDWQNRAFFLQRLWTLVPGQLSSHSALSSYGLLALCSLVTLAVFSLIYAATDTAFC